MYDNTKANISVSFLHRTLDLAATGQGEVFIGPWLGWVVVANEHIVAEGTAKSELVALEKVGILKKNCLFLSINPFASDQELAVWCAALSVDAFFVATAPESPVCQEALYLNRRFFTWQQRKRPYLILKWAETADGFIAPAHSDPYWISNTHARRLVHQWRSQEAAIWVGKTTSLHDNPRLNVRFWTGPNPLRIVIDPRLQLPQDLHFFDQSQPTLCYTDQKAEIRQNLEFAKTPDSSASWEERVRFVLADLYVRQIQSVLVEGGTTLLSFLIDQGWWDEARVFRAPLNFEEGLSAPHINDQYKYSDQRVSDNMLTVYRKN